MRFILERLTERSTWRGIVITLTAFGISLEPQLTEAIITAGLGLAGLVDILLPEQTGKPRPPQ